MSNVIIHQDAIDKLLAGPEITRFIEGKAREITEITQGKVRDYFQSAPSVDVDQDVGFTMDGATAVIGIQDKGNKSRRLVDKGLLQDWLVDAKEAVRE